MSGPRSCGCRSAAGSADDESTDDGHGSEPGGKEADADENYAHYSPFDDRVVRCILRQLATASCVKAATAA